MAFISPDLVLPARTIPSSLETKTQVDGSQDGGVNSQPAQASLPTKAARSVGGLEYVPMELITRLSVDETEELRKLLEIPSSPARTALIERLQSDATSSSTPLLLQLDSKGQTLLHRLYELSTQPMLPAFEQAGISRNEVVESVLNEVLHPGEINQSSKGTCAATSMQYMLVARQPAEFVRLMVGLVSPAGKVALANGETLKRVSDSIRPDTSLRSVSERLFQSAMMDFSNPGKYSNDKDLNIVNLLVAKLRHAGTKRSDKGLSALFNQPYRSFRGWYGDGSKSFDESLLEVMRRAAPNEIYCSMNWESPQSKQNDDRAHAVTLVAIRDGRVFFRNPWGSDGQYVREQGPKREIEDEKTGLESMEIKDFLKDIHKVYAPESSLPDQRAGLQAMIQSR
jgi:hypothetical protein